MINNAAGKLGENAFDIMASNNKEKANLNKQDGAPNFADYIVEDSKANEVKTDNIEKKPVENPSQDGEVKNKSASESEEKDKKETNDNENIIPAFWLAIQTPIEAQNINTEAGSDLIVQNNPSEVMIDLSQITLPIKQEAIDLSKLQNTANQEVKNESNELFVPAANDEQITAELIPSENLNLNTENLQLSPSALNELAKIGIGEKSQSLKEALDKLNSNNKSDGKIISSQAKHSNIENTEAQPENENLTQTFDKIDFQNTDFKPELAGANTKINAGEGEKIKNTKIENSNDNKLEIDLSIKSENIETKSVVNNETPKLNINNLDAIAATLVKKAANGEKTFFIRLDPAELGKIEVELKIGQDQKITAIIKAETPQALNELMRSAKDLVQSLNQSGLEMKEQDLSFNLNNGFENSQNSFANQKENQEYKNLFSRNLNTQEVKVQNPEIIKPIKHEIWGQTRISITA